VDQTWAADVVLKLNAPNDAEIAALRPDATVVSLISPALKPDLVEMLASRPITALAMDAVPRISRAQSLDVFSSMANIAGYRAVVEAAHRFGRFFTGQVTAAGKVPPATGHKSSLMLRSWMASVGSILTSVQPPARASRMRAPRVRLRTNAIRR